MDISVFCIDNRLIHGQIITVWIVCADARTIIVADDKTAEDEFQRPPLKMATPGSIALRVLSVDDTIIYIQSGEGGRKVLLLMRDPERVLRFIGTRIEKDQINVGNMSMREDKIKMLGNLWVFPEDTETVRRIYGHDVRLGVWTVPDERSQDVMELLKKCKLA